MDDQCCVFWLLQCYGFLVCIDIVMNVVLLVVDEKYFYDVCEYFEGFKWDGVLCV